MAIGSSGVGEYVEENQERDSEIKVQQDSCPYKDRCYRGSDCSLQYQAQGGNGGCDIRRAVSLLERIPLGKSKLFIKIILQGNFRR